MRKIDEQLPQDIQKEVDARLAEIAKLLATIAPEVQGINRHRYSRSLICLEELVEALTFYHYLKTQTLINPEQLGPIIQSLIQQGTEQSAAESTAEDQVMENAAPAEKLPTIELTDDDYLYGVFDLTGEMMRFATTSSALTGKMASGSEGEDARDIVQDMHELGSMLEMLPVRRYQWEKKLEVTRQSVQKVEKLGYDLKVRGSERPKGWVPDLSAGDQPEDDD